MYKAIELAQKAKMQKEVPIGAVLVLKNKIVGQGYNQTISKIDPSAHAEIIALRDAAKRLNNYRLINTTIYVTLEPCPMCAYALLYSRVSRLVYGCENPKTGACGGGGILNLFKYKWNHKIKCDSRILYSECSNILNHFFHDIRKKYS